MEESLTSSFKNINDWLRYAETKSATLLGANGVLIFGLVRTFQQWQQIPDWALWYGIFVLLLVAASSALLLISFSPSMDMPWRFKSKKPESSDNLLYFDHVAKYSPLKYLQSYCAASGKPEHQPTDMEVMLAKQIIANSVIAKRKFEIFNLAVWLSITALVSPVLAFLARRRSH